MRKGAPLAGLALILCSAAVVLVGAYVFLPSLLETWAARGIQDRLGLENTPKLELQRGTLPGMLAGRFPGGRVTMDEVDVGGVRSERVVLVLDPLDLDLPASILRGGIESQRPLSGALRAEVSEVEVSRLAKRAADVPVREVELEEDAVVVGSEASALGLVIPVSVRGSLDVRDGRLVFVPLRVSALGTPLPEGVGAQLLAGADFSYPLDGSPRGVSFTAVDVAEGRLVLSGEIQRLPLDQAVS